MEFWVMMKFFLVVFLTGFFYFFSGCKDYFLFSPNQNLLHHENLYRTRSCRVFRHLQVRRRLSDLSSKSQVESRNWRIQMQKVRSLQVHNQEEKFSAGLQFMPPCGEPNCGYNFPQSEIRSSKCLFYCLRDEHQHLRTFSLPDVDQIGSK